MIDYKHMHKSRQKLCKSCENKSNQTAMPSVWLSLAVGAGSFVACAVIMFCLGAVITLKLTGAV
jgi:hypothetical protein